MNTKKYVVIEVIERNISTPEVFDTYEEALKQMLKWFCEATGHNEATVRATCIPDGDYIGDDYFGAFTAYGSNANNDNCDWSIFKMEG